MVSARIGYGKHVYGFAFVFQSSPIFRLRGLRQQTDSANQNRSSWCTRSYPGVAGFRYGLTLRMGTGQENKSTDQVELGKDTAELKLNTIPPSRMALGVFYTGFIVYSFFLAPGSVTDGQIINILSGKLDGVNDLFFAVFNLLGATGLNYVALLNAGASNQKRLPTELFSVSSFFFGFFAIGPYLVGRKYVPNATREDIHERGLLSRIFESRIFSVGTVIYALWAYAFAFGLFTPGTMEYHDVLLYSSWVNLTRLAAVDRGVCVSCLDFVTLSSLVWGPLTEDMTRRGWFRKGKEMESIISALSFMMVPALGPAVYLVLRSRLPGREKVSKNG